MQSLLQSAVESNPSRRSVDQDTAAVRSRVFRVTPGFTLIELMIVVVIVAILSAIAYPSYVEYVRKGRRVDAQAAMLELAQFMERHYTTSNSYSGATLPTAVTNRVGDFYTITLSAQAAQTYTLSAAPKGAQSGDKCGTLTLTNTGAEAAGASGCWD